MIPLPQRGGTSLSKLLAGLADIDTAQERVVGGLSLDSRTTQPRDLFLACPGARGHGAQYIPEALRAGAAAIAIDTGSETGNPEGGEVPLIPIPRLRAAVGLIADRFYGEPSRELQVVGITGTNGKTSVSQLVAQALNGCRGMGEPDMGCGVLGTLGHGVPGRLEPAINTTPDAITIHRWLRQMRADGMRTAVLEVSSHGLAQDRVAGVRFGVAVLTNLSRDHLDYHPDMIAYGAAKKRLFQAPGLAVAVLNLDDPFSAEVRATLSPSTRVVGYGLRERAAPESDDVLGSQLWLGPRGMSLSVRSPWGEGEIESPLIGRFNAYNLLAALATLLALGLPLEAALGNLNRAAPPPGRLERFDSGPGHPLVVVDYAHTPDGLEQALHALRPLHRGRLYCIFGCGGDRDAGKRALMGAVAEALADQIVVTTDNPRGENPQAISAAILNGMRCPERVRLEPDRERAIAWALADAGEDDVVLVAGKGHEDYQEIAGVRWPYSDREAVQRLLQEIGR